MPKKAAKPDCCTKPYPSHQAEIPRLNRIAGQMAGVQKMIAERRYCPDILTQLRAMRAALRAVEANILETYLASCVTEAFDSGDSREREAKMAELKELYKKLS